VALLQLCALPANAAEQDTSGYQWNLATDMWGFVDQTGKVVIPPRYAHVSEFQHGFAECYPYASGGRTPDWEKLFLVDKTGRGYLAPGGDQRPKPQSNQASYAFDLQGHHIVRELYRQSTTRGSLMLFGGMPNWMICDASGYVLEVLPPKWVMHGEDPKTGDLWCSVGKKAFAFTGAIGKSSMPGFQPVEFPKEVGEEYEYRDRFSEGLRAVMSKDGHWAYIDTDGRIQIDLPKDCSNAKPFSEGLAAVCVGGTPWTGATKSDPRPHCGAIFGFIDKTGHFVIPPRFPSPHHPWQSLFKNGLAMGTDYKNGDIAFGFINRKGDFVVPAIYKSVDDFADGLAAVNAGPIGFDKQKWRTATVLTREQGLGGYQRKDQFCQFLRQYDFIGMPRSQVLDLLGPPTNGTPDHFECYQLSSGCVDNMMLLVYFKNDRVSGYSLASPGEFPKALVTTNDKPQLGDDWSLYSFYKEHAHEPEPLQSASAITENCYASESILVAEYAGHEAQDTITADHQVRAIFHPRRILKGPPVGTSQLPIRFDFDDKSGGTGLNGRKFDESLMPKPGSQWILFIQYAYPQHGMYATFHGASGRIECNEANLIQVLKALDTAHLNREQAEHSHQPTQGH